MRLQLDTEQTLALNEILTKLTQYCKENLGWGGNTPVFSLERADEVVKVAPSRKNVIQKLVDGNYEEEFWQELKNLNPKAATKLAYAQLYESRRLALEEFQNQLKLQNWDEPDWQKFFEHNPWILGYGLTYKWLRPVGKKFETVTKGSTFNEAGKRPDTFAQVVAAVATTVFGDIKKPQTPLLWKKEYRPSVYIPHREVIGGVQQIQKSIDDWISEGHTKYIIKDEGGYDKEVVYSHRPKGILIVGNLEQFKKDGSYNDDKIASFENYRRETSNPEIITFDELYHRAKNIVSTTPEDSGK